MSHRHFCRHGRGVGRSSCSTASMASVLLVSLLLLAPAIHVVGQPGFLSIDCGLDDQYSGYTGQDTGITYVSDGPYVDGGENVEVAPEYMTSQWSREYHTVRMFPSGLRNCYSLPTEAGSKYLIRLGVVYGNHDGKNDNSTLQFDVHLGTNYWETVYAINNGIYEALFVAWASWAPVCLVNTGHGAPFVSLLELRKLPGALYTPVTTSNAMYMLNRLNMGGSSFTRFPDDQYDRYWWTEVGPQSTNRSTSQKIQPGSMLVPQAVLQTALEPAANVTTYNYTWVGRSASPSMVFLHFADFQGTQVRQFDIYFNDKRSDKPYSPLFLAGSALSNSVWVRTADSKYNITLAATATSVLPPMLNALEIYTLLKFDSLTTFPKDFDAIMTIKLEYGVKKNWMGDPCFPADQYAWEGVKCRNTSANTFRIVSINLSNCSLRGAISKNFTLLTALENLDLSYNNLSGSIPDSLTSLSSLRFLNLSGNKLSPDSLCKNYNGSLTVRLHLNLTVTFKQVIFSLKLIPYLIVLCNFRYDSDGYKCNIAPSPPNRPLITKAAIIAISVAVPVLVVAILLLACFFWREKRKPNEQQVSTHDPTRDPQVENATGSRKSHVDYLSKNENRRFTYKELEMFTNNFKRLIGQGGFGPVYYGRLEDNTEVAIKMRSESSSHGLDQFLAEVESLTKVHHRNIVSLIGYCWEKDHLALVYEYMSQGSLFDRVRGKNAAVETLNWGTRVRVVLEAAQGLDYLHKGCSPPIIHRDVKSANILLGQNMQAKIADLGLSKTYLTDAQSHMYATAAGTAGYMDPQYYLTGRLTESSDVYSFGIVLLEVATGEPPMVPGYGHIVPRVQQMIATGDISSVADARLGGAYDISSMWKLVDTAMVCTAESAAQRPTMAAVVAQLKESLGLEEVREKDASTGLSRVSDIPPMTSTFRPMAR
ncbi:hypothetical protein EJB05_42705, partial [Eragrostis curvula]